MPAIDIYMLVYNEMMILPYTFRHYKALFPDVTFTVYDNMSTDGSAQWCRAQGATVISWDSNGKIDDDKYIQIKNNVWKKSRGWAIVCDCDEWLEITAAQLEKEQALGTTMLNTYGFDVVGIDMKQSLTERKGLYNKRMSKSVCFFVPAVKEINFTLGAHTCKPVGNIKVSTTQYVLRHQHFGSLGYALHKHEKSYARASAMRARGLAVHYRADAKHVTDIYRDHLSKRTDCPIVNADAVALFLANAEK